MRNDMINIPNLKKAIRDKFYQRCQLSNSQLVQTVLSYTSCMM